MGQEGAAARQRFVIVTVGRTGSTLLCELLDSHPDITCKREVFNAEALFFKEFGARSNRAWMRDPHRSLEQFWERCGSTGICGFKMLPYHGGLQFFNDVLTDSRILKIVLHRPNLIRRYVSHMNGHRYSVFHWEKGFARQVLAENLYITADALLLRDFRQAYRSLRRIARLIRHAGKWKSGYHPEPLTIDPKHFRRKCEMVRRFYRETLSVLTEYKQPYIEITYDQLVGPQRHEAMSHLLEFLGAAPRELHCRGLKKLHDAPLTELIANYSEVQRALAGTPLASMLDAPEPHPAAYGIAWESELRHVSAEQLSE